MIETKPRINRGNRGQLFRATWTPNLLILRYAYKKTSKWKRVLLHVVPVALSIC